jgi:glyoxylase-like metal-dependent hydrolase (beta-lactamase superfamily II)
MTQQTYRFNIGDLECIALCDNTGAMPASRLFANAPKDELDEAIKKYGLNPDAVDSTMNPLFVKAGERRVLIDTGLGVAGNGKTLENLTSAGVSPADIDTVIITHAHGDHVGGVLNAEGKHNFPKACYVMSQREWDHWHLPDSMKRLDEARANMARKTFGAMEGLTDFVDFDHESELFPGFCAIPTPGHTPGHLAIEITSGNEQFVHIADAAHSIVQFEHPDWSPAFDTDGVQSAASRRMLFERLASSGAWLMAYHIPFPGIGKVIRQGATWAWQPR